MNDDNLKEEIKKDIHKEFALERIILFSDAVFAIVITLMAIEIRLPETEGRMTPEKLNEALLHVLPTILAYCVSFSFVGVIWYQHLKLYNLLKSYDKGLVIRNLGLLFLIGLFPFTSMVVSRGPKNVLLPVLIYMMVIICCIAMLVVIEHYILFKRPELRNNLDITKHIKRHKERRFSLISFSIVIILVLISNHLITDPNLFFIHSFIIILLPISVLIYKRINKEK